MNLEIKELTSIKDLNACVRLQTDVFDLPNVELSPARHFVVTMHAGGFTLGAFDGESLIGFSLSVPAFLGGKKAFYSHMTAVLPGYQKKGIGYELKLAQRLESLRRNVNLIKWTFQPEKSLNAYFNLEKLGAEVGEYIPNFYGTDYGTKTKPKIPIESDRLFALWRLDSPKATALANRASFDFGTEPDLEIEAIEDWQSLVETNREKANREQTRLRNELTEAFSNGFVCRAFTKPPNPKYLLYKEIGV